MTIIALAYKTIIQRLWRIQKSEETTPSEASESSPPKRTFFAQNPHKLTSIDMIDRIGLI